MKPLTDTDPHRIGSYRLLGVLGSGGMGRVYLGQSTAGRRLAVKVIRAELAEDPVFRRRFAREVAIVRAVSPLCTAPVVDADVEAPLPWVATTYIDGPGLDTWVEQHGPLAPGAVLTLAAGLAEALASIHECGLVHRDLKPSNVLLDREGPRIIDFGIAVTPDATKLTTSFVGTPSYTSPERLRGEPAAQAGDVFSLGATLVYAATGRKLVRDGTVYEQILQITNGRFDLSAVPRELRPVITWCLARRPKDRPSAAELAGQLAPGDVTDPHWYRSPATAVMPVPGGRLPRRRLLLVGGALGLAAAGGVAGAAVAFGRGSGPRRAAPGIIRWQAGSGAPVPTGAQDLEVPGDRIVVDRGQRLITIAGSEVLATEVTGRPAWRKPVPGGLPALWQWGDAVLVTAGTRVWSFDAATGAQRFAVDAAAAVSGATGPRRVVIAADRAFLDLGAALVAVDRAGRLAWQAPAASPGGADADWVVTQDVADSEARTGLYAAGTGALRWTTRYAVPPLDAGPPPGGPSGPSGGDGGADGPPDRPPRDPSWLRSESRIAGGYLVLRDIQELQSVRVADGGTVWRASWGTPIAAIEVVGDLVVVSADRLTARSVATGATVWEAPVRGARIAARTDRPGVLLASEQSVSCVAATGRLEWTTPLPAALGDAVPERVSTDGRSMFVTFRTRPGGRQGAVDTLGLAL